MATDSLPYFEEEAKKRQIEAGKEHGRGKVTEKIPEANSGESREKAAQAVGVNPRYVSDAKRIKEASPETFEKLKASIPILPPVHDIALGGPW